jgi:hypothetical protein
MKLDYKKIVCCVSLLLMIIAVELIARVRTIQSDREFDQQLSKSDLLVALLYDGGNKQERKNNQKDMANFFRMYETVSSKKLYDDADIIFTKLNSNNSNVASIAKRYAVNAYPCFLLFIKGRPVVDKNGNIVQLRGFISEQQLQDFLNFHFSSYITVTVETKEQNRKERVKRSQEESDPYFYPAVYYAPEYDFTWQKPLKYDAQGNEK